MWGQTPKHPPNFWCNTWMLPYPSKTWLQFIFQATIPSLVCCVTLRRLELNIRFVTQVLVSRPASQNIVIVSIYIRELLKGGLTYIYDGLIGLNISEKNLLGSIVPVNKLRLGHHLKRSVSNNTLYRIFWSITMYSRPTEIRFGRVWESTPMFLN